ncbi:MAG TPA: hypothetical protein G4N96_05365 [Chloroflexi bacterium]|nr:hypothetical protein [Chloroflexota bacterium]
MEPPLLQAKLYIPPPQPDLVPRPRLIERLNEGLHRKQPSSPSWLALSRPRWSAV